MKYRRWIRRTQGVGRLVFRASGAARRRRGDGDATRRRDESVDFQGNYWIEGARSKAESEEDPSRQSQSDELAALSLFKMAANGTPEMAVDVAPKFLDKLSALEITSALATTIEAISNSPQIVRPELLRCVVDLRERYLDPARKIVNTSGVLAKLLILQGLADPDNPTAFQTAYDELRERSPLSLYLAASRLPSSREKNDDPLFPRVDFVPRGGGLTTGQLLKDVEHILIANNQTNSLARLYEVFADQIAPPATNGD